MDKEWCKSIEDELRGLKKRIEKLEGNTGWSGPNQKIIELDIEWPEADIGGLHFNAQKTNGVFKLKEDGNYYSRDILFISARDTYEGTGRDLLSEYLDSEAVREAFLAAIGNDVEQTDTIRVFLPEENQGIKKWNGVRFWYWLRRRESTSAASFTYVNASGYHGSETACSWVGCVPAFCVGHIRHE
jgi:hypothetical protein